MGTLHCVGMGTWQEVAQGHCTAWEWGRWGWGHGRGCAWGHCRGGHRGLQEPGPLPGSPPAAPAPALPCPAPLRSCRQRPEPCVPAPGVSQGAPGPAGPSVEDDDGGREGPAAAPAARPCPPPPRAASTCWPAAGPGEAWQGPRCRAHGPLVWPRGLPAGRAAPAPATSCLCSLLPFPGQSRGAAGGRRGRWCRGAGWLRPCPIPVLHPCLAATSQGPPEPPAWEPVMLGPGGLHTSGVAGPGCPGSCSLRGGSPRPCPVPTARSRERCIPLLPQHQDLTSILHHLGVGLGDL